jgi:DNA primase
MTRNNRARLDAAVVRNYFISKLSDIRWRENQGTAHCPFHDDRRESFSVNAEKGLFFCHACGAKGNLEQFEQKFSDCSLKNARSRIFIQR